MFSGLIRRWRTQCPPWARQLGLAKEHFDISRRHARVRAAWEPHLQASRAAMLAAAARCDRRDHVLVIGAGDCLDVPVAELAGLFTRVTLADIVVSAAARRWAKDLPERVNVVSWDASGALVELARRREAIAGAEAPRIFAEADPGPPPGGEADLVISANCISQLGLVPGHSLPAMAQDKELPERCARAAAKRHLAWLKERKGLCLLVADVARLDLAPDGRVLKRDTLHERFGLPKPAQTWRWDLAPIPEWSPDFHRVHEVGTWLEGPAHPDSL